MGKIIFSLFLLLCLTKVNALDDSTDKTTVVLQCTITGPNNMKAGPNKTNDYFLYLDKQEMNIKINRPGSFLYEGPVEKIDDNDVIANCAKEPGRFCRITLSRRSLEFSMASATADMSNLFEWRGSCRPAPEPKF